MLVAVEVDTARGDSPCWAGHTEDIARGEAVAVADLEVLEEGGHAARRSLVDNQGESYIPCDVAEEVAAGAASRLDLAWVGTVRVAQVWWGCAGRWNRASMYGSPVQAWHGPSGCAGCKDNALEEGGARVDWRGAVGKEVSDGHAPCLVAHTAG